MQKILELLVWLLAWAYGKAGDTVRFVRKWHEVVSIPIAFALWYLSPIFLRWLDPTAAVFDSGILQKMLFGVIALFIGNGTVWLLIKLTFPKAYRFLDDKMEMMLGNHKLDKEPSGSEKMYYLTSFQKCVIVLALYISLLLCYALLVIAL
jgi:hypothetical protein